MEQKENTKKKSTAKKTDSKAIRFEKDFIKEVEKLSDKANKKQFGKLVRPKNIIVNLLALADASLIEKVIENCQEESLTIKDEKELFLKESKNQFKGNKEDLERFMMKLAKDYFAQNLS